MSITNLRVEEMGYIQDARIVIDVSIIGVSCNMLGNIDLLVLGANMRQDSESWHKVIHSKGKDELRTHYALGLCGEAGEVADEIKKMSYDEGATARRVDLAAELADVFTYLLLLADLEGIDLVDSYMQKRAHNIERWGDPEQVEG